MPPDAAVARRKTAPGQGEQRRRGRADDEGGRALQPAGRPRRFAGDLARRLGERGAFDLALSLHERPEQRAVAEDVDQTRHPAAEALQPADHRRGEKILAGSGNLEPVPDIRARLLARERPEVEAGRHPLRELTQFRSGERGAQLGLAHQDDLQQFAAARLEVGEQPHLLEHRRAEVLRFVDDQDGPLAGRVDPGESG